MARKAFQETVSSVYGLDFTVLENDSNCDFVLSLVVRDEMGRELCTSYMTDAQAQALAINLNVARNLYHNRQDAKIPKCEVCRGSGSVEMDDFYGPSYYAQCSACKGTGKA